MTEVFTLGRFGEVDLSVGGRLDNPTNEVAPGAPAIALQDAQRPAPDPARRRHQHPEPRPDVCYPQGGLSAANTLRVGDTLPSLTGVLGFGFSRYRVQPVGPIEFDHTNPRPASPDGRRRRGPGGGVQRAQLLQRRRRRRRLPDRPWRRRRAFEFDRQRDKIIAAITELDADVVGLMELENDDTDAEYGAIEDLVDGLNAADGCRHLRLHRHRRRRHRRDPRGHPLPAGRRDPGRERTRSSTPRSTRGSSTTSTGRRSPRRSRSTPDGARFTAVVNHLKSKGSDCNARRRPRHR